MSHVYQFRRKLSVFGKNRSIGTNYALLSLVISGCMVAWMHGCMGWVWEI
jgi:hypothetical protein